MLRAQQWISTLWNRSRSRITAISAHRSMTVSHCSSPLVALKSLFLRTGRKEQSCNYERSATPENYAYTGIPFSLKDRCKQAGQPSVWESRFLTKAKFSRFFRGQCRLISNCRAIFQIFNFNFTGDERWMERRASSSWNYYLRREGGAMITILSRGFLMEYSSRGYSNGKVGHGRYTRSSCPLPWNFSAAHGGSSCARNYARR